MYDSCIYLCCIIYCIFIRGEGRNSKKAERKDQSKKKKEEYDSRYYRDHKYDRHVTTISNRDQSSW